MDEPDLPQLYLISPSECDLSIFPDQLGRVLDAHQVACVRLALSSQDQTTISRSAEALRAVTRARDVALVIEQHLLLVEPSMTAGGITTHQ